MIVFRMIQLAWGTCNVKWSKLWMQVMVIDSLLHGKHYLAPALCITLAVTTIKVKYKYVGPNVTVYVYFLVTMHKLSQLPEIFREVHLSQTYRIQSREKVCFFVTLDHQNSHKGQFFFEIEIYSSSKAFYWCNVWFVRTIVGRDTIIWKSGIWGCKKIEILRKSPLKLLN